MTATNHALTGAVIASFVRQPLLALPLAFASHLVCDALPHFGIRLKYGSKGMFIWLGTEALVMLSLLIFFLSYGVDNWIYLALGALVAMSPDFAWYYYGSRGRQRQIETYHPFNRFHSQIQWSETVMPGILIELIWAIIMITIILKQA